MKKILMNIKNSKSLFLILGFLLGITLTCGSVYATTVLSGSNVSYSNTSSKLTATTVQGAIDEIYNNMVPIDPNTFQTNAAKTIYASSKGVCIKRNNKLNCFKPNNCDIEKEHIKKVFSDGNCTENSSYVFCDGSDFDCTVSTNGRVGCNANSTESFCRVYGDGSVECR